MQNNETIGSIIGQIVSAVCFVQDYVEIHFDGPILRCLRSPLVESKGFAGTFPQKGSRDALCSLIGEKLLSLQVNDRVRLVAGFTSGARLVVALGPDREASLEALHFVPRTGGPIQVW